MYTLLVLPCLLALTSGDSSNHYSLKYPAPHPGLEPQAPLLESKPHDSVGATYQAITQNHHSGTPSSSTTAEILHTISSPHSRSSVSFTTTSGHHPTTPGTYAPPHPEAPVAYAPAHHEAPLVYAPLSTGPHPTTPGPYAPPPHKTPLVYAPLHHEAPLAYAPAYHEAPYPTPAPHDIVNPSAPHHETPPPTYTYRIPPNQTDGYPPTPRVAPKAFNYQPVLTLSNNIKSFYKINAYTPFVVPPSQYYADSYLSNLVYPGPELYKTYPDSSYKAYPPAPIPAKVVTGSPYETSPTPAPAYAYEPSASPAAPSPYKPSHAPLSLPPPEGLSLVQGVPKPYRDNAYIEPPRPLFTPVLVFKKYSP